MKKILLVLLLLITLPLLLACKEKETTYTLTLRGNGGTPITYTLQFTHMEDIGALPFTPRRSGYEFGGYYTSQFCPMNEAQWFDTVVVDFEGYGNFYKWEEDLTAYACWLPL